MTRQLTDIRLSMFLVLGCSLDRYPTVHGIYVEGNHSPQATSTLSHSTKDAHN